MSATFKDLQQELQFPTSVGLHMVTMLFKDWLLWLNPEKLFAMGCTIHIYKAIQAIEFAVHPSQKQL